MAVWKVVLIAVLATMVLSSPIFALFGYFLWHVFGDSGEVQVMVRVEEQMLTAYEEGRYRDVVSIYEARHHVRFQEDWSPAESTILGAPMVFRIAESYREEGDAEAARQHYLAVIEWTEWDYQAHCRLGLNECSSDVILRDLARMKAGEAQ